MIILYVLIGLLVGGLGIYLLLRPKLKVTSQRNIQIEQENQQLEIENKNLAAIKKHREELLAAVDQDYYKMNAKRDEIKQSLEDLKATQKKAAEDLYSQALNIAENSYEKEIDRISDDLFKRREEAQSLYLQVTEEAVQEFQIAIEHKKKELSDLTTQFNSEKQNVEIALEAARRKLEMETQQDYYRI